MVDGWRFGVHLKYAVSNVARYIWHMRVIERLPDDLLAAGQSAVTTEEIAQRLGRDPALLRPGLARLKSKRQLFSPAKGLYVPIPPEYRSWGVIPAEQFIDRLMGHLHRQYYVALLSAAEMHGVAHHAPQLFQVMVDRQLRPKHIERVRLRFYVGRRVGDDRGIELRTVRTGTVRLCSKELMLLDLVEYPQAAAGLGNVATIVREIGPLDMSLLATLAAGRPRAMIRRLGWLLDRFASQVDATALLAIADGSSGAADPLATDGPSSGDVDRKWGVIVNDEVEPEL